MQYLEQELYNLVRNDDGVLDFIQNSVSDGMWYLNVHEPTHAWMNHRFWETFGYNKDSLPKDSFELIIDIINKDDYEVSQKLWEDHFSGLTPMYDQIVRYTHADGHLMYIHCRGRVVNFINGQPTRMLGIHIDVTGEVLSKQKELKSKDDMLDGVYRSIPGAVMRYTRYTDGREQLNFVSDGIYNLYKVSAKDAAQNLQLLWEKIDPEYIPGFIESMNESEKNCSPWYYKWKVNHDDNKSVWLQGRGEAVRVDGLGTQWTSVLIDVTDQVNAEKRLSEEQIRFRALIQNGNDVYIVTTPEKVKYVSPNIERMLGYTLEEFLNIPLELFVHPNDLPLRWDEMRNERDVLTIDYRALHKDGNYRWIQASGINQSHIPEIGGMLFSLRDISELKRKEEEVLTLNQELDEKVKVRTAELMRSEFLLREAQKLAKLGSWEFDLINSTIKWSPEFHVIMGVSVGEIPPQFDDHIKFFGQYHFDLLSAKVNLAITDGVPYEIDLPLYRPDGTTGWIVSKGMAVRDASGRAVSLVGTALDITERKKWEEDLRFNKEQLQNTNEELEAFAYSVSHDLRAPLRGINGWSVALKEDYGNKLDEVAHDYIDRVINEAQHMNEVIEGLLTLSRVTRHQFKSEIFSLSDVVKGVVQRYQLLTDCSQYTFEVEEGVMVRGDKTLMKVAVENIISNAIKFSNKVTKPVIKFYSLNVGGETILNFQDNGAGFDLEKAKTLFTPFQRFHRKSEFNGTGIGLATVKRVVNAHKGHIHVESAINKGTLISITFSNH
jgi:PAS domain S-box-containing protein